MDSLNSPIAVVAILAGLAVMFREVFFFARSMKKNGSSDKLLVEINRNLEQIAVTLKEVVETLRDVERGVYALGSKLEAHEKLDERIEFDVKEIRNHIHELRLVKQ